MKRKFYYLAFFVYLICVISCKFDKTIEEIDIDNQRNDRYCVNFINNSSHSVSVYLSHSRTIDNFLVEIPAMSKQEKDLDILAEESITFYFVYNLNFGIKDFSYPYYDNNSFEVKAIKKNKTVDCIIDELSIDKKNSSFIFITNNTTSDIYLKNGDYPISPYGVDNKFVTTGTSALYVINKNNENDSQNLSLPLKNITINGGGDKFIIDFPVFDYKLGFV